MDDIIAIFLAIWIPLVVASAGFDLMRTPKRNQEEI